MRARTHVAHPNVQIDMPTMMITIDLRSLAIFDALLSILTCDLASIVSGGVII